MICYTDTAEFFTQAIAVPNIDFDGESLSCVSYSCTAEGTSSSNLRLYAVVYGPWSGAQETPTEAACLRYQQKNSKTGAPLDSWTYAAIDLAACDLETGKPVGNTYNSVAVVSTVMCCAEPDCNAPDPQLDSLTKAGPTITQALLQQDPSFDVSSIKRVNKAATTADGEVAPLPHTLQAPTNSDRVIVYKLMAGATAVNEQADIDEQANSMLEYQLQLLQSGVMPMAEDVYSSGSYGGYGYDGAYGGYGADGAYGSQPVE
ncbi:hypothetical protein COO60DRAFT_1639434 [Scenedesmus sp. NREL 46B-D3]|nr:hypothetical protein COO60DRAFT_1639434 [Scenedesmus sp. NREL 46B-D3]